MEIEINNAMDNFLKKNFNGEENNVEHLEKYFTKILEKDNIKICSRYKLCSGKINSRKKIWYTKEFNYKYGFFWKRKIKYMNDEEIMKYEFEGNEIYFENTNNIETCFRRAIKAYSQFIFQMNKSQQKFVTFLQLVEAEDENGSCNWNIQIRFYLDREKSRNVQTLWGNVKDFQNATLFIYV
ncbi:MAG: hypothetical protein HFG31_05010 [Eubacterium sp.]|nr:hypothetical protein [Eubacterium sp.]